MWRSLEDKTAEPAELQKLAEEEQPGGFITDLLSPKALVSRRSFVQGSSIAALAVSRVTVNADVPATAVNNSVTNVDS